LTHGPADKPIEVRVQDEARIGQKTGRVRIRARKGTSPRWPADQRYKSACLFGAVCADRETGAAPMLPWGADTGTRNLPLKEIRRPVAKGAQDAVLIFLPARSPGLNRVEKVWQSLRKNELSNRLFEDQTDGLAAGCDVWTRLMKEPGAIQSGASRDWTQNRQT